MSISDDLHPCPFCGGKAILDRCLYDMADPERGYSHYGFCQRCATEGPWARTEAGATRRWNARREAERLRAERDALRAVVDAAIALRRGGDADTDTDPLDAWMAAEAALYDAVDALLAAQEGQR